jgi:hypothetical protein
VTQAKRRSARLEQAIVLRVVQVLRQRADAPGAISAPPGRTPDGIPTYPATAKAFLDDFLSVGNAVAPDEAFRKCRGRDVDTEALMRLRGFA